MKVLVDTSVWVNLFSNLNTPGVALLKRAIDEENDLVVCGPVVMELLQGCHSEREVKKIRSIIDDLMYVDTVEAIYEKSAMLYRQLRRRGITIRKSMDCLIASVAIHHDLNLICDDRDFMPISKYSQLKIYAG